MSDSPDDVGLNGERDPNPEGSLLSRISTEMVRAMKHYYGKGPVHAKSYFVDDLLFVVMRGGITRSEETMLHAGHQDTVRQFRQDFENEMAPRLTEMIEQLTGRHVVNYQSQILFDPDMTVEIFVFENQAGRREREETAEAVKAVDSPIGLAREQEVQHPNPPSE